MVKQLRAYLRVRNDAGPYLFTGREGPFSTPAAALSTSRTT